MFSLLDPGDLVALYAEAGHRALLVEDERVDFVIVFDVICLARASSTTTTYGPTPTSNPPLRSRTLTAASFWKNSA
jgi:hypothetical protein